MRSFASIFIISMPVWLSYFALFSLRQQQNIVLYETAALFNGLSVNDGIYKADCNGIWSCSALIENMSTVLEVKPIGPPITNVESLFELFGKHLQFDMVDTPMSS